MLVLVSICHTVLGTWNNKDAVSFFHDTAVFLLTLFVITHLVIVLVGKCNKIDIIYTDIHNADNHTAVQYFSLIKVYIWINRKLVVSVPSMGDILWLLYIRVPILYIVHCII